jgi:hypothetical protein
MKGLRIERHDFINGPRTDPRPGVSITRDEEGRRYLQLTIEPDELHVCRVCRYLHINLDDAVTSDRLRKLAKKISVLADALAAAEKEHV